MTVEAKICGLTRPADAAAAAAGGAAYLGVVFASGSRAISVARAADVAAAGQGLPVLGVFGRQPVDEIVQICRSAGLRGAQLHGPYPREAAAALRAQGVLVWRVARVADSRDLESLEEIALDADAVLVEPCVSHADGGTGVALDLGLARAARLRVPATRMVLAGGLTPENVARAVALVRPDVVDVSSGIEQETGIKDRVKLARFLEAAVGDSSPI